MARWTYTSVKTKRDKRQIAWSFNRLYEKLPTKSSFKWSVLIMDKGECRPSTGINFGTFSIFDKRLTKFRCILIKTRKIIGLIRKLQPAIPRAALLNSFLRSHLDFGDVIYDRAFKESFQNKLESVQYNAPLAITGAVRDSSRETLYQELGLHSLKAR